MRSIKCCLNTAMIIFTSFNIIAQSADYTKGCAPLTINFTAPGGLNDYFWDFKNNVNSNLQDPVATFISPGVYNVELKEGQNGPLVGAITITVLPKPVLIAFADPERGCAPLDVHFTHSNIVHPDIQVTNYIWTFGDGGFRTGEETPQYVYPDGGLYDVSLSIETDVYNCDVVENFPELVEAAEKPDADFEISPDLSVVCDTPHTVTFTNTSKGTGFLGFFWDFGNGQTSMEETPPVQLFDEEGVYRIKLSVTGSNGCIATAERVLTIGKPMIDLIYRDTICLNILEKIKSNSSFGFYEWDFGPNGIPKQSNAREPLVYFTTSGAQSVSLRIYSVDRECFNDTTIQIFVEAPDASFTTVPSYTCNDSLMVNYTPTNQDAFLYDWLFYDSTGSNDKNPTHLNYDRDTTIYSINGPIHFETRLILISKHGCIDTFSRSDTAHMPNARFMPDKVHGCGPLNVIFSDSSTSNEPILDWEWDYGDGTVVHLNNGADHNHNYSDPGTYNVVLVIRNSAGCIDTSYAVVIEVGTTLTPDFTVDKTSVCQGELVTFTSTNNPSEVDGWRFITDNGRAFHCYQDTAIEWVFKTETGLFDASLTLDYNGCYTTITKEDLIEVKGPIARLDYEIICNEPHDVYFRDSSMDATSLLWDFGDSSQHTIPVLQHEYDSTGDYRVILKAENDMTGCPASYDTAIIYVRDILAGFDLDEQICAGTEYPLSAVNSQDVAARCHKGYTWFFTRDRPITTADSIIDFRFRARGDWTVYLVVEDINGCKDTATAETNVTGVNPDFKMDKNRICYPSDVQFMDLSFGDTTLVEWEWDFGDGHTSTERNPLHTYKNGPQDSIIVTLTVRDTFECSFFTQNKISVYRPQTDIFTVPEPPRICTGETVNFRGRDFTGEGSFLNFEWSFGNGSFDTGRLTSSTFDKSGQFNVELIGTEDATGCMDTANIVVDVQDYPEANFTSDADPNNPNCAGEQVFFEDASKGTGALVQLWNLGNSRFPTGPEVATVYNKGTYTVQLIVETTNGCKDTVEQTYTFIKPEGDFVSDKDTICSGDDVFLHLIDTVDVDRYIWEISGNEIINQDPVSASFFNDGSRDSTNVVLKLFKEQCEFKLEHPIYFKRIIADFDSLMNCQGMHAFDNLSEGADQYEWDFGDGEQSIFKYPIHEFTSSGTFKVKLVATDDIYGCKDSITKNVVIYPLPEVQGEDDVICDGESVQLLIKDPVGSSAYAWESSNPNGGVSVNGMTDTLSGSQSFQFSLKETDNLGCVGFDEVIVELVQPLDITDWDTLVCPNSTLILPAADSFGYYTFQWSPMVDGCSNCKNPQYLAVMTDSFELRYYSPKGCFDTTAYFTISVLDSDFRMPKAFTPNRDNVNDYFNLIGGALPVNENTVKRFEVFSRWGELVYNNETPLTGWNGSVNGKDASPDVYLYILQLELNNCSVLLKGDVTLLR